MFPNKWTKLTEQIANADYSSEEKPFFTVVDSGTVLPAKPFDQKSWGLGGVVDSDGKIVTASLSKSFGGYYEADLKHCIEIPETVYYIPLIPRHWGHFLVDVISKLWFVLDQDKGYRIAFCGEGWDENRITGNYLQLLSGLGIEEERLLYVQQVTRFDKILIPSATFGASDDKTYNGFYYRKLVQRIIQEVMASPEISEMTPIRKVYFTRTGFYRAKVNEIGEKDIEKLFEKNGYTVLAPEKLPISEQIFYFQTADEIASLSGTIPHNAMFAGSNTRLIILNRTCIPNYTQIKINQMFNLSAVFIDCYSRWTERHPRTYGGKDGGPIWVEVNNNLLNFFRNRKMSADEPAKMAYLKNIMGFLKISGRITLRKNRVVMSVYGKMKNRG